MVPVPYQITEAVIQCFGRAFHFKDAVAGFMGSCGVPVELIEKYRDEAKYVWARRVMQELGTTDEGVFIQKRIVTELCKLRNIPDEGVKDKSSGLDALRKLQVLAKKNKIEYQEEKRLVSSKRLLAEEKNKQIQARAERLENLRKRFIEGFKADNRQAEGFSLERILQELFEIFEINYKKSYKTSTQQIDGYFNFEGFDYLVEAKWRKGTPTEQEIGGFQYKVNNKIESTRGVFISINGFRDEVVNAFDGKGANLIFMSGKELAMILEGMMDLREVLKEKIMIAAQEGRVFVEIMPR